MPLAGDSRAQLGRVVEEEQLGTPDPDMEGEVRIEVEVEVEAPGPELVTVAEAVSARQQISLWLLTQTSQEWAGSVRSLLGLGGGAGRGRGAGLRKCATDVKFRIEEDSDPDTEEEGGHEPGPVSTGQGGQSYSVHKTERGSLMKHFARKGNRQ